MPALKFTDPDHWQGIERHLGQVGGKRFAFAYTRTIANTAAGPVLEVVDTTLVDELDTTRGIDGWHLGDQALDHVHNHALATGLGIVEFHNHDHGPPGFSHTDEDSLAPAVSYCLELLAGTPYGAAVWADGALHAEWWRTDAGGRVERGQFSTVTVLGDQLRVLNAKPVFQERPARHLPLIGTRAQAALTAIRVAVVGVGGVGSHVAQGLAYLGFGNVLLMDDDLVEITDLNRMVTAGYTDIGQQKTQVTHRRMRAIDPLIDVSTAGGLTVAGEHPELEDVDLIIGCVDDDGPRNRLNQIATRTRTPYLDIATGADDSVQPFTLGGRVILTTPHGPCLSCLGELDAAEISRWARTADQQESDRLRSYGAGGKSPSAVYLNGLTVNAALTELAAWLSGARPPAPWLDVDVIGDLSRPGTQVGPRQVNGPDPGCITCAGGNRWRDTRGPHPAVREPCR
ncbi:ThiF family adenylyltransferase [Jatrophihabitans sp.]|jgi:molybdopterin/thiamine biosynthesis adenylyltransferase|uniref:ThiF family adenylyltransferase n=1 Tax=Jatrophihabitans sp. TaxID=1932789 RepID=UPI002F1D73FE